MRRLLPLALVLAGCGGGGGGKTSDGLSRVSIDWPDAARAFQGSPLARSAIVRFEDPVTSAAVASSVFVRPDGTGATTRTYTMPSRIAAGTYVLKVFFCAGTEGAAEGIVGFGTASAVVRSDGRLRGPDGEELGDVGLSSTLASLAVAPSQQVGVGQKTSLSVSATTNGGGVVPVPFGFVSYSVASGGASVRASADGTVTGLLPGTATLVATAFGRSSEAQTVTVVAR